MHDVQCKQHGTFNERLPNAASTAQQGLLAPSVGGDLCSVRGELVDKRITSNVTDVPSKEYDVHSERTSIPAYSRVINIYTR